MGRPVLIMSDGECDERAMRRVRVTVTDLLVAMREQGIERTADVRYAILEADGRISFFTRDTQDA